MTHTLTRLAGLTGLLGCLLLAACSGIEIIPDDTSAFAATGHTRYAWRSEPLSQDGYSKSKVYQADPIIRAAVDQASCRAWLPADQCRGCAVPGRLRRGRRFQRRAACA